MSVSMGTQAFILALWPTRLTQMEKWMENCLAKIMQPSHRAKTVTFTWEGKIQCLVVNDQN